MSRFIREETRGHSARTVEGLAGGAGGGGLLTIPQGTIITPRGFEVAHAYVSGGVLRDRFTAGINQVSGWKENGSVPRVAAALPPGCVSPPGRAVEGAGPFSVPAYFSLGAGPDALDFTQPFSAAFVFAISQIPSGASEVVFGNSAAASPGVGYLFDVLVGGACRCLFGSAPQAQTANVVSTNAVNVLCGGWDGSEIILKLNLGTAALVALTSISPGTSSTSMLGRYDGGAPFLHGTLYEAWFSALVPSDALFTSIMNEAKGRLGITAW